MRLPELSREHLTERQRQSFDRLMGGPRQGVRGPFAAWIRSPEFVDRAETLGRYLRFEAVLPKRINELAILMVAKHWGSGFVWTAHLSLAHDAGVAAAVIEAIRRDRAPFFDGEADRITHDFVGSLLDDKRISDHTWRDAVAQFGEQGVVELLGITGYYGMVAMTMIAMDIETDQHSPFAKSLD